MSSVISGVEEILNKEGYSLIINQSLESYEQEVKSATTMLDNRVAGLFVSLAYNTNDILHFEPFLKRKVPVVFFDRIAENRNAIRVEIDNKKAVYDITTHLINQNCRNIMYVTAILKQKVYIDRFEGYKQALKENSIRYTKDSVFICDLSFEAGELVAEHVINSAKRPDAIVFANDKCAVGCMVKMQNAGIKIPDDIAIAGFNDDPISRVIKPGLTTVKYDGKAMGIVSAGALLNILKEKNNRVRGAKILLDSDILLRDSSKK